MAGNPAGFLNTFTMFIINIVNSDIGKQGTIGQRTGYIIENLINKTTYNHFAIARGSNSKFLNYTKTQGFSKYISRILNLYRIYFNNKYNCRDYDIKKFDKFSVNKLKKHDLNKKKCKKIIHIWEPCINTIQLAKKLDYKVILDVPIAPSLHSLSLQKQNLLGNVSFDLNRLIHDEKIIFDLVDHFIAPSEFVQNVICKYGISKSKISIVNFGVDSNKYTCTPTSENSSIKFCFAGVINRRKGIKYLLEAFDDKLFSNDELHLCGRLFEEERKLLNKLNCKNIVVPGIVDTSKYFRKCDVYVFPSLMEGSSKSVFEAMASGLPVITTNYSGSIIRNGIDGFVVPAGNSTLIKEKMVELKSNYSLRKQMGEAAKKHVSAYTWEKYSDNILKIYRDIYN